MSTPDGPTPAPRQRLATVVVIDLKGSTALAEQLDPELLRSVLTQYFDVMRAVFERRGGVVVKIIGDALVVVFEAEDASLAARRAGVAVVAARAELIPLNDRFEATLGIRLQNRTGVASGLLSGGSGDAAGDVLAGEVVGVAESLEAASPVGAALIDEATRSLLRGAGVTEAVDAVPRRGHAGDTVEAWRLIDVDDDDRLDGPPADGADARRGGAGTEPNRDTRRTVTIVFADPRPMRTADRSRPDPETTGRAMTVYRDTMAPILAAHGGTVEKFIGDAMMAVFGLPVRHEDDAARAVRAAAEMSAALVALNASATATLGVTFESPIGVNTGPVVAADSADGDRLVTGDAVNVAARLEQTAAAGQVVLGALTRRLVGEVATVEELEPLTLKGKSEPVAAFRLVHIGRPEGTSRRHGLPLVGRADELAALRTAFDDAVASRGCRRVTVVGDAGTGKSRLIEEFLAGASGTARVVRGNCLAYGEGITFWPLLRVLHDAASIAEDDEVTVARGRLAAVAGGDADVLERLAAIAGLVTTTFPLAELEWATRSAFDALAAERPLVVLLDDIHWAEPTLLDILDGLVASVRSPVLVVCSARPTVRDRHAGFVDGATTIEVRPLTDDDGAAFLRLLLGRDAVDERVIAGIASASGGNPLFIEQLLSMLIDDGRLVEEHGEWVVRADLSTVEIPATVEAVLAARIDRLGPDERRTIGPASVIGRRFVVDALAHVVEPDVRPVIDEHLRAVARRDLVVPEPDQGPDAEPAYRFQHQLIRDATYQTLLKESRARLHEQFVDWAEAKNAERDRGTEFEEILGYHLEQAHRCWDELGVRDDRAATVGRRGARHLSAAGERALRRGDMPAAANLLGRAVALLPATDPDRPRALLVAANSLHEVGEFDRSIEVYEESAATAERLGDVAAAVAARMEGLRLRYLIGRIDDVEEVSVELDRARAALGPSPDPDPMSRIWQLRLNVAIAACQWSAAQRAAEAVIEFATAAGNDVLAVRTMPLLAFLAQKGPMPVEAATAVCLDVAERVAGDRRSSSMTRLELAMLAAMAGDLERARALCTETRATLVDLGWEMQAALVSLTSGPIELLADRPDLAEAELRRDYDALLRMGERNFISLTAALLADAVYRQDRFEEAADLVEFSSSIVAPDDLAVLIVVATVSAKLAARRGERGAAFALIDDAERMMATTEDPSGLADVLMDRAEVLALTGDAPGPQVSLSAAADAYRRKGNLAGVARARRRVDALA